MDQQTAEARRSGIGGSDVPAILGEVPRRRSVDVWLEKTGQPEAEAFGGNKRTRWGQRLEPMIANLIAEEWGTSCGLEVRRVGLARHKDRHWQLGSADRLGYLLERKGKAPRARTAELVDKRTAFLAQPDEGLEIKTHGFFAGKDYTEEDSSEDAVPTKIRLQCDWYMSVFDLDRWNLACLIDTADDREYVIQRDRELEAALLEEMDRWWRRHVVEGVAPDPDGSERFDRYVRERYKDHGVEIVRRPELAEVMREYRGAHEAAKEAEARKELAKQQLCLAIGAAAGVETPAGVVTWKRAASGGVDYKGLVETLAAEHGISAPELAAHLQKHTRPGSRRIHTKWSK